MPLPPYCQQVATYVTRSGLEVTRFTWTSLLAPLLVPVLLSAA